MSHIGIDLGTTYSAVATLDESGRPVILKNDNEQESPKGNLTASAVLFKGDQVIVGEQARKRIGLSANVAARFKRLMGTSKGIEVAGRSHTPTELSALVLKRMKKIAEDSLGQIEKAVVTIPANFSNEARVATMKAASMAGLNIEQIINEPTAAALHYAYQHKDEVSGVYAVYDLGGGTFDISVISIDGSQVDVITSNGIPKLGGVDFDAALIELIARKYKEEAGENLDQELYTLTDAEEDKIKLSAKKRAIAGGLREDLDDETIFITRSEFEEAISSLIAQTEMTCEATISEAELNVEDIKGVILVGGSTRMPVVRESVKRIFKQEPITTEDPDEAVALGAALYAAVKSRGKGLTTVQNRAVSTISLGEVANLYYGVESLDPMGDGKQPVNSILINKGEKLPCSATDTFYTVADGQTRLRCKIMESNTSDRDPRWAKVIWEGYLELPSGRPRGQEIEVTFSYDENQIMHCSFQDLASGKKKEIDISFLEGAGRTLDTSAIDKFLDDDDDDDDDD